MVRSLPAILVAFLCTLGAAEHPPLEEIPDPIGLGPRLALIDYLREHFEVTLEDGMTYEQLAERYSELTAGDGDGESVSPGLAEARRRLFVEHGRVAPDELDEQGVLDLIARLGGEAERAQRAMAASSRGDGALDAAGTDPVDQRWGGDAGGDDGAPWTLVPYSTFSLPPGSGLGIDGDSATLLDGTVRLAVVAVRRLAETEPSRALVQEQAARRGAVGDVAGGDGWHLARFHGEGVVGSVLVMAGSGSVAFVVAEAERLTPAQHRHVDDTLTAGAVVDRTVQDMLAEYAVVSPEGAEMELGLFSNQNLVLERPLSGEDVGRGKLTVSFTWSTRREVPDFSSDGCIATILATRPGTRVGEVVARNDGADVASAIIALDGQDRVMGCCLKRYDEWILGVITVGPRSASTVVDDSRAIFANAGMLE